MSDPKPLSVILLNWKTIRSEWDDRASARLQETCLQPMAEQTLLLERQHEEITRFLALMDTELEELDTSN